MPETAMPAAPQRASATPATTTDALPLAGLLALAMTGFLIILTEALPAGLLPQMGASLHGSPSLMGQLVTIYAVGSLLAAIPLVAATQGVRRRPLLMTMIAGFAAANAVTALSDNFMLTMVARACAGVCAGLLWALIAGYAARMVPGKLKGRAIAIAMVGTPIALAVGIPAGTWLGNAIGWRLTFGLVSLLALVLLGWILARLPDFPGQPAGKRQTLVQVFVLPGMRPVMLVTLAFVLAHNLLYTYIAAFLALAPQPARTDTVLFVFGAAALPGIWLVGALIHRWLRALAVACVGLFLLAAVMLALAPAVPALVYLAVAVWGLGFGGAATVFQTGSSNAAGAAQDVAQSIMVTTWNIAIAGGGLAGGALLGSVGAGAFPWALIALLCAALGAIVIGRSHAFAPPVHAHGGV